MSHFDTFLFQYMLLILTDIFSVDEVVHLGRTIADFA